MYFLFFFECIFAFAFISTKVLIVYFHALPVLYYYCIHPPKIILYLQQELSLTLEGCHRSHTCLWQANTVHVVSTCGIVHWLRAPKLLPCICGSCDFSSSTLSTAVQQLSSICTDANTTDEFRNVLYTHYFVLHNLQLISIHVLSINSLYSLQLPIPWHIHVHVHV